MNYEEDIKIDDSALDVEWLNQPSLMMKYAKNASVCQHDLDIAEEALNLVKASLDKRIRLKPEDFDIAKITETIISNTIISHEEYRKEYKKYLEVKHALNIAKNAVTSMHQRKDALEYLVRLFGQQYFAGPSMPRNLSEQAEHKRKQSNNVVGAKMKKKKLKRKK